MKGESALTLASYSGSAPFSTRAPASFVWRAFRLPVRPDKYRVCQTTCLQAAGREKCKFQFGLLEISAFAA